MHRSPSARPSATDGSSTCAPRSPRSHRRRMSPPSSSAISQWPPRRCATGANILGKLGRRSAQRQRASPCAWPGRRTLAPAWGGGQGRLDCPESHGEWRADWRKRPRRRTEKRKAQPRPTQPSRCPPRPRSAARPSTVRPPTPATASWPRRRRGRGLPRDRAQRARPRSARPTTDPPAPTATDREHGRRPRLREPVRPADRPARARARRLLGAAPARHPVRRARASRRPRHHPVGQPELGLRRRRAAAGPGHLVGHGSPSSASATAPS